MSQLSKVDRQPAPKGVTAKFHRVDEQVRNHDMIAIVSFHGKMPDGSRGKAHGRYIAAQAAYWMTYLNAITLILDFRDLDYKWGDSMLGVFQTVEQYFRENWNDIDMAVPVKLLSSAKSSGLQSLVTNQELYFATLDDAIEACNRDIEYWFDTDAVSSGT